MDRCTPERLRRGVAPSPPHEREIIDTLLTTTRSVRRRLDLTRPVEPQVIDECLEIALQAPNGSGAERWRFVVVTDVSVRSAVGALYARTSAEYLETLRAGDPELDETTPGFQSSAFLWSHLGDVPVLVVPCFELEPWHQRSSQYAYVHASVYGTIFPAAWSFQLAARARGLGTTLVTSPLKYVDELRSILALPDHFAIGGVIAVAHTTGTFRTAPRRPLAEVRRFDRWSVGAASGRGEAALPDLDGVGAGEQPEVDQAP